MRIRRVAAATTVAALAGGAALLISTQGSSAATPTPTQITLGRQRPRHELLSAADQRNSGDPAGHSAVRPAGVLGSLNKYSLTILSEAKTNPAQKPATYDVPNAGKQITFGTGTYDLSWKESTLSAIGLPSVVVLQQKAKLIISTNAQKCVVAVSVPQPSVSVPGAGPVNSIVNGVVGGVVSGVNSAVAPVNSAVGPILGGANGALGGITGGSTNGGGANGGKPANGSGLGTIYTPSDLTPAQRRVPQGGGAGGGGAGSSSQDGSSVNAPALGFKGVGSGSTAKNVKSGGSPNTVDLAAAKPRSALDGWANLIVLVAVLALSGATAFYARTYLLHPLPAKAHARS